MLEGAQLITFFGLNFFSGYIFVFFHDLRDDDWRIPCTPLLLEGFLFMFAVSS